MAIEADTETVGALATVRQRCMAILRKNVIASDVVLAVHAAEGLTEIGYANEVHDAFSPRFTRELNPRTRCLLARELFRAGDLSRLNVLTDVLRQTDESLQIVAAESLYKVRQLGDPKLLRQCLVNTGNAKLQLMIHAAFACQGDDSSLNCIRAFLANPVAESRKIAAWILTRLGGESDIALLHEKRLAEENVLVRAYIDHAMAALNDAASIKFLQNNFYSANSEIRQMAADSARLIKALPDTQKFNVLLDDADCDVRIRAAHALLCLGH